MKTLLAWLKASRLPSQSYIFLPLMLGQVLAWRHTGRWDMTAAVCVQLFGVFDQLYIVYANDYADRDTDPLNATYTIFSGGSRALVDGDLSPAALRNASVVMAALAMATTVGLGVTSGAWVTVPLGAAGVALLWMYSYGPVRLSYRGGGELLQMLGVAGVLPLLGYAGQSGGSLAGMEPWVIALLLPTNLACGMATALPDAPADADCGKHTAPVWLGDTGAKLAIVGLNVVSAGLGWVALGALGLEGAWRWALPAGAAGLALALVPLIRVSQPGTRWILAWVFGAVLITVAWSAGLIAALVWGLGG